jgi:hypothetical protein
MFLHALCTPPSLQVVHPSLEYHISQLSLVWQTDVGEDRLAVGSRLS